MEWRARICVSVCVGFLIWVRLRSGKLKGLYREGLGVVWEGVTVKNEVARVYVLMLLTV